MKKIAICTIKPIKSFEHGKKLVKSAYLGSLLQNGLRQKFASFERLEGNKKEPLWLFFINGTPVLDFNNSKV